MKPISRLFIVVAGIALASGAAGAQQIDDAKRTRNRVQLAQLLDDAGPGVNMSFQRSTGQPYNYSGLLTTGLTHAESFDVVFGVSDVDTYMLKAYPKYKGGYVNVDKAKDPAALMRALLNLSFRTFLFWGIDNEGDVFVAYTFTLESGFPEEAIKVVLRSIVIHDKFFGELRPLIE
jgi:hypothetical protein